MLEHRPAICHRHQVKRMSNSCGCVTFSECGHLWHDGRRQPLRHMATSHVTFRFGGFELDTTAYELRRKGRRIRLARQPMDLLVLMLERPGALVSRDEIRKRLWSEDVFVDVDASIRTAILEIRQVLGDSGESPRFVETVTGKGYRFIAPVESSRRTLRRCRPLPPHRAPL